MPTEVVMPQMGESITEGTITKWLKQPGESVERDEPLFEISTDKVDAEIPSPAAGTLQEIRTPEGSTVQINTVVALIGEAGAKPSAGVAPAKLPETAAAPAVDSAEPAAASSTAATQGNPPAVPGTESGQSAPSETNEASAGTEVVMPQMGESITEGTITKWLKKVGDTVQRDEPIFEISTDKVDAEIPSPIAGKLSEIKVQEGQTVTINTVVAVIGGGAAAPSPKAAPAQAAAPAQQQNGKPSAAPPASGAQAEHVRSSPLVRKIARDNNVDLGQLSGSGASGRITKGDILEHIEGSSTASAPAPSTAAAAPATQPTYTQAESAKATTAPAKAATATTPMPGELVPMSRMRSIIAQRMVESKRTSAHVHTVFKVDMTRIVRLREKEKNKYEQRNGVKLTYMPFITRAAVAALRKHPIVNSATEGDAVRYNKNINIGIAVALEWGLIVPVIKQAEEKSFLGIARSIVDVADRARSKKLAPDEVAGGTFTLTNSGIFGEQFGTPIIAQPQSAILGIGGLNKEALVLTDKDGQDTIAIRSIQRFTLGFDHRIIDGADAGKFMSDFKAYLENWSEDIG
ncbi:MAG: 2-oxoglutarate dehydrogenase, E2 component, dihydrolipoamide succinyltransferase [Acidobacteriaceae bacterium]